MLDKTAGANQSPSRDTKLLLTPNVRVYGLIDDNAVRNCIESIQNIRESDAPLVFELMTEGGDAEGGRRIALEVKLLREHFGREAYFIGKTVVMSAGATIMSAFPRDFRYVTSDTVLLIHERRMQKTLDLNGPIRANIQIVREMLAQLETAERLERQGFEDLAEGSRLTEEQLYQRAIENCYLSAQEALELGIIAGVI